MEYLFWFERKLFGDGGGGEEVTNGIGMNAVISPRIFVRAEAGGIFRKTIDIDEGNFHCGSNANSIFELFLHHPGVFPAGEGNPVGSAGGEVVVKRGDLGKNIDIWGGLLGRFDKSGKGLPVSVTVVGKFQIVGKGAEDDNIRTEAGKSGIGAALIGEGCGKAGKTFVDGLAPNSIVIEGERGRGKAIFKTGVEQR